MRVVGIYNADGGLSGELRYVFDKLLGRSDCGLCDLTHGWNALGKRAWREACRASTVPIELIHRDKATPSQLTSAGSLPVVLVEDEGAWRRGRRRGTDPVPAQGAGQVTGPSGESDRRRWTVGPAAGRPMGGRSR